MEWTKEQIQAGVDIMFDQAKHAESFHRVVDLIMDYAASLVDGRVKELEVEVSELKIMNKRLGYGNTGWPQVAGLKHEISLLSGELADVWNGNAKQRDVIDTCESRIGELRAEVARLKVENAALRAEPQYRFNCSPVTPAEKPAPVVHCRAINQITGKPSCPICEFVFPAGWPDEATLRTYDWTAVTCPDCLKHKPTKIPETHEERLEAFMRKQSFYEQEQERARHCGYDEGYHAGLFDGLNEKIRRHQWENKVNKPKPAPVKPSKPKVKRFTIEEALSTLSRGCQGFSISVKARGLVAVNAGAHSDKFLADDDHFYPAEALDWE